MSKRQVAIYLDDKDIDWLRDHPSVRATGIVEEYIVEHRAIEERKAAKAAANKSNAIIDG